MSFWEKMEEKEADLDWIMIKCSLGSIWRFGWKAKSSLAGKPRLVWVGKPLSGKRTFSII